MHKSLFGPNAVELLLEDEDVYVVDLYRSKSHKLVKEQKKHFTKHWISIKRTSISHKKHNYYYFQIIST